MKKTVTFLSVFVFIAVSCGQAPKKQAKTANGNETLQAIYAVIDSVGFVELPYKASYGQAGVIFVEGARIVSHAIGSTYGVLPDTSNFYGILYSNGISATPYLATYDKKGNIISSEMLGEENSWEKNMAGKILICDEYTIINKNLTLHYYFYSKHLYEGVSGEYDSLICEHFEKRGKIDAMGKITFEKREEFLVDDSTVEDTVRYQIGGKLFYNRFNPSDSITVIKTHYYTVPKEHRWRNPAVLREYLFIVHNRHSDAHPNFEASEFDKKYDTEYYRRTYEQVFKQQLDAIPSKYIDPAIKDFNGHWVYLKEHNGNYYLNNRWDFITSFRIADSIFFHHYQDGPDPRKIVEAVSLPDNGISIFFDNTLRNPFITICSI